MSDILKVFLVGGVCGSILTLSFVVTFPGGKVSQYDSAIRECQLPLPRNQNCKIIAIPISKEVK